MFTRGRQKLDSVIFALNDCKIFFFSFPLREVLFWISVGSSPSTLLGKLSDVFVFVYGSDQQVVRSGGKG